MSEIPADIRDTASELIYQCDGVPSDGNIEKIARALLAAQEAQRERDAKIAESFAQAWDNGKENHENPHYACMDIADTIRAGRV